MNSSRLSMARLAGVVVVGMGLALVNGAIAENAADDDPPLSAAGLLQDVRDRLPQERLHITGDLTVRKWGSGVQRTLKFQSDLELGADPASAQYTLFDAFGRELEQLTVTHAVGGSPEFSFASGRPLVIRTTPNLTQTIRGTDISWMDLTLSFLWWTPRAEVGHDKVRGRPCYVIEVSRPVGGSDEADASPGYAAARLWIDREARVLLQAEALNSAAEPVRRLWVKSIKKMNGRWMVKDMEVEGIRSERRTRLTIRKVVTALDHEDN